jgi:hypothetical protein
MLKSGPAGAFDTPARDHATEHVMRALFPMSSTPSTRHDGSRFITGI